MNFANPSDAPADPNGATQPVRLEADQLSHYQPIRVQKPVLLKKSNGRSPLVTLLISLAVGLGLYFLAPLPTRMLILGIDRPLEGTEAGRSDIQIIVSVNPLQPKIGMLSIPRDLWIEIPGYGENRINTAHYFAELEAPGSGAKAARRVIEDNFGVSLPYYVRVNFDGFRGLVEALGGVRVNLPEDMAGLPAGEHLLDPDQALAFVRSRSGADDFYRMQHTQLFLRAMVAQMLRPQTWPKLPAVFLAASRMVDTTLPVWQWPRIGLALLRAGSKSIDSRTLTREMVTPFTTNQGAQVLLPDWGTILPVVQEMFGGPLR